MEKRSVGMIISLVAVCIIMVLSACGNTRTADSPVATEDPTSVYTARIIVDFVPNLVFSKYDVKVDIDGTLLGVLSHGEDSEYSIQLKEGIHLLRFSKNGDTSVGGDTRLAVTSDIVASYKISCYRDRVDIETVSMDYLNNSNSDIVKINCGNTDFHGKSIDEVLSILN